MKWKLKGTDKVVNAPYMWKAVTKFFPEDEVKYYTRHWYTRVIRPAWCEVVMNDGEKHIILEVKE